MPDTTALNLYIAAAFLLAVTPGPGIFYVLTRSIQGGHRDGYLSAFGTAVGGMFHVVAAALGLSTILATSAVAFTVVKYAGAAYLITLGVQAIRSKDVDFDEEASENRQVRHTFYQGIMTEVLNPKTALFFLAFIPQFIQPDGNIILQFVLLGCISVFLNTSADLAVVALAGSISEQLRKSARLRKVPRLFSGIGLIALGAFVALSETDA